MRILILMLCLFPALAQAKEFDVTGCGLGSLLWSEEPRTRFALLLEASSNESLGFQTLGISSDTSNCVDSKSKYASIKMKMFIDANHQALAKDIARGDGETLAALAKLLNCTDGSMGPLLQKNYESIFPNDQVPPEAVSESIRSILRVSHVSCEYLS